MELGVEIDAVRHGTLAGRQRLPPVEPGVQDVIGQGLDLWPVQARHAGPRHRHPDRAYADPQALGDLTVAAPQHELLTENLARLSHG
jgi:hypothetical protein